MQQQPHRFHMADSGAGVDYLLALPADYQRNSPRRWPLLLFLHGRGERGADLELVKKHGLARKLVTEEDFPFITVSPQCPAESDWFDQMDVLSTLLDDVSATYAVDPRRIYLTGLSMGGRGAWQLAARHPQRFAALAPICGRIPDVPGFLDQIAVLKEMPTWVFHGAKDPVVPLENSEKLVAALQACGGDVRFTVYPEATHDSWTATYENPRLYTWLLQYSLP
ncbi:MAG: phospholipase [Chloroflexi bacterium]|nr:MAG: phospholipase [Chloroflexota bacterium]